MTDLFKSPADMIADGLPLDSQLVQNCQMELLLWALNGLLRREHDLITYTEKGLEWYDSQKGALPTPKVLERKAEEPPAENSTSPPPGTKRFRDIAVGSKFKINVGRTPHKLTLRKLNDAEEDNAETDVENPELCTFPENQPVFPVL